MRALLCAAALLLLPPPLLRAPGAAAWPGGALCPRRRAGPGGARYVAFLSGGPGPAALVESAWGARGGLRSCWARRDPRLARAFRAACAQRPPRGDSGDRGDSADRGDSGAAAAALRRELAALWRHRGVCREPGGRGARRRRGWTVPGTLWCGAGDSAASPAELGLFRGPDRCCREHDRCEAQIAALEFNYGIRNYRLHTVSHCDCDSRFRRCLLDLNDTISNLIGVTFFDLLEVPCFVLEPSEQCVQWHWWGGCQRYGMVPLARMVQPRQYHAGPPSSPEEEEGTNGATRQPPREGRRNPPRLGRKRLWQRQKQRLVTVPPPPATGSLSPAAPSGEAEPTSGSLPAPRAVVAVQEQDSEGRQELGAAREGGTGSAQPNGTAEREGNGVGPSTAVREGDDIGPSVAAEAPGATSVLPPQQGHGQSCSCFKRLDKCEQQVAPREVKYALHNTDTRTLFHCNCTHRLARCLRRARVLSAAEEAVLMERVGPGCFILEPPAACGPAKEPRHDCIAAPQALLIPAWHLRSALRHWGPLPADALARQRGQMAEDSGGTLYQRCLQLASEQREGARLPAAPR